MQLAEHELHDIKELIMSCVNTITNMAHFMQAAQNPELKSLIEQHFAAHIQDYNIKVEYVKNVNGATQKLQVPPLNKNLNLSQITTQTAGAGSTPIIPRTQVPEFNDYEIATAYLLTLKRAGREYAWAAMEATEPDVREFLEDAFRMASHHAYDIWQWMAKQGYYPYQPAPQNDINLIGQMFEVVHQQQTPMM